MGKPNKKSWIQCENCLVKIKKKDLEIHLEHCSSDVKLRTYDFIEENILKAQLVELKDDRKNKISLDFDRHNINSIVFISQEVMEILHLTPAEIVILSADDENIRTAKYAWPISDNSNSLYITKDSKELLFNDNVTVALQKCEKTLPEASKVVLELINPPKNFSFYKELRKRISKDDYILCKGDKLGLLFYGKKFEIDVINISSDDDDEKVDNSSKSYEFLKTCESTCWIFSNEFKKPDNLYIEFKGLSSLLQKFRLIITTGLKKESSSNNILVHGYYGTGKTTLVNALVSEFEVPVFEILSSKDATEDNIENIFEGALESSPSIIVVHDIDHLCPFKNTATSWEISSTLKAKLDKLNRIPNSGVIFIAVAFKPDEINQKIRLCMRFEIEIPIPDENIRREMLTRLLERTAHRVDNSHLNEILSNTHGFVISDLLSLYEEAKVNAKLRGGDEVTLDDFRQAKKIVGPTAMKEFRIEVPNVKWEDIGGQQELKSILSNIVNWPEEYKQYGYLPPKGILMFGPPGCSKTMIAKALARESGLNFISVKGPELFNKYVGESERAVREIFNRAKQVAPSVLFFDEFDALGSGETANSSNGVRENVVRQFLAELDGYQSLENVIILAATNKPHKIDSALLRQGRIGEHVYVPLPDEHTRKGIFKVILSKLPVSPDVKIERLSFLTEGYSGAEIKAICYKALDKAFSEDRKGKILPQHFLLALKDIPPATDQSLVEVNELFHLKNRSKEINRISECEQSVLEANESKFVSLKISESGRQVLRPIVRYLLDFLKFNVPFIFCLFCFYLYKR